MTTEWQSHSGAVTGGTPKTQYTYSEMASGANHSRLTGTVYPSGFELRYDYGSSTFVTDPGLNDRISRVSDVFSPDDNTLVQAFDYLGLNTVIRDARGNSVGLFMTDVQGGTPANDAGDQYTGLDRFGRIVEQQWYTGDQDRAVDRFAYTYDRDSNRTTATNMVDNSFSQTFSYDGLNQLTGFNQGSGTHTQSWDYDATGNWDSLTTDSGTPETRSANKQNQITSISGATTPTYDADGNMTGDETGKTFVYDAWNRLVAVKSGSTVLKSYGYDGLNHRVTETTSSTVRDLYYSARGQVVEETVTPVGGGTTKLNMRYVWGEGYVNDMVYRQRDTDNDGVLDERLWPTHDANFNITSLVDDAGSAVERYVYDPFGGRKVYDVDYNLLSGGSNYGWQYGFQGMRFDAVSGLNAADARWYSPTLGRWVGVDPIRFTGGDENLYGFVGNNPTNKLDPTGLADSAKGKLGGPTRVTIITAKEKYYLYRPTAEELFKALKQIQQESDTIQSIDISGHGSEEHVSLEEGGEIRVSRDASDNDAWKIYAVSAKGNFELTIALKATTNTNTKIDLRVCNSAGIEEFGPKGTITDKMAKALPGVAVTGSQGASWIWFGTVIVRPNPLTVRSPYIDPSRIPIGPPKDWSHLFKPMPDPVYVKPYR